MIDKNLEKLKTLAKELEDENLSLDKSYSKYAEACALIEESVKELAETKGKVTVLRTKVEEMIEENM